MMHRRVQQLWPQREQLCSDPALAILAALDAVLDLVIRSLVASHPCLSDPQKPYVLPPLLPSDTVAPEVIAIGRQLQNALRDYRNAVIQDNQIKQERFGSPDDIPF
jgi:hypothetical protein